ncbi:MAG: hypothetical protein LUG83_09710 [Lachnospiraceae bacterium]|nr:hypothetical protein [Lachnospiraceae bacterium]
MDLKRTTNRRHEQGNMRKEIDEFFTELIPELNLRLLLDIEPAYGTLWVEEIIVTACEAAPEETFVLSKTGGRIRRLRNCLTGLWAKVCSLKK